MEQLNQTLVSQLRQYIDAGQEIPKGFSEFLQSVSDSYDAHSRAQQKIEEQEQHQQLFEEINDQGSWVYYFGVTNSPEDSHWVNSPASLRIPGFEPQTPNISSEQYYARVHPDDRSAITAAFNHALATQSLFDVEHRALLPNGQTKVIHSVNAVPVDFDAIITGSLENLKYIQCAKKVDVRVEVDNNVQLHSDPERTGIVLNNIMANALRYYNSAATDPSVHIAVSTYGDGTHISISDNGIGIAADRQEKVFEMFYRLSGRFYGFWPQTLYCKGDVQRLNGTISLRSELNEGTKFTVVLPNLQQDGRNN